MTAPTLTLADFLLARIAEDEAVALAAHPENDWEVQAAEEGCYRIVTPTLDAETFDVGERWLVSDGHNPEDYARGGCEDLETATHIARFDPKRVLRECAAKRAIVERAQSVINSFGRGAESSATDGVGRSRWVDVNRRERSHARMTLGALASVYAEHVDYRNEWRMSDADVPAARRDIALRSDPALIVSPEGDARTNRRAVRAAEAANAERDAARDEWRP